MKPSGGRARDLSKGESKLKTTKKSLTRKITFLRYLKYGLDFLKGAQKLTNVAVNCLVVSYYSHKNEEKKEGTNLS